jgi:hypothetical protein
MITYLNFEIHLTSRPQSWFLPLFTVFFWYKVFSVIYRVQFKDDNSIVFRSLLKSTIVYPNEIQKILDNMFTFKIITQKGNIVISTLIKKPYELKRKIENLNTKIHSEDVLQKDMEKAEKKHPLTILLWAFLSITILLYFLL